MADRCQACGGWAQPTDTHCPNCHTRLAAEAELGGRDPFDDPLAADGDLPGLDLDPSWGRPAAGAARPAGNAASAGLPAVLGSASEPPLPPAAASRRPARAGATPAAAADSAAPGPVLPPASAAAAPVHEPSDADVHAAAAYEEPSAGPLGAVFYTLHVWNRRSALQAAHAEARRKHAAARRGTEAACAELGRVLAQQREELDLGAVRHRLQAADEAAARAHAQGSQRARAQADAEERRRELAAQLDQARRDADPWKDRETKLRTQLDLRQADVRRAEAALKRAEIELRNLRDQAATDPARIQLLDSDRQAREHEAELGRTKVRELTEELGQVRRELASRLGRIAALEEERKRSETTLSRAATVHGSGADEAQRALQRAMAELGEEAVQRGLAAPLGALAERATRALAERRQRAREERLYERATVVYDHRTFKRGLTVLGAAGSVVLLALLLAIAL